MKYYKEKNVYESAVERINYLFDEFSNIIVGFSGGKDSTIIYNLCLQISKERNRLPLNVMWLDQEAEWQSTVDIVKEIMYNDNVNPYWFQIPMVITNNASSFDRFNFCWDEKYKDKWIHNQDKISLKENKYGTMRFHDLFSSIMNVEFPNKSCYISGVRCEESPSRFMGLTSWATYKDITWGAVLNKKKEQYTFYPIYDWSYTDVWKYIHDNNCKYNKLYDVFYKIGQNLREMRVSCIHHETSIHHLMQVHEIEPETWERVINRIGGANTIKTLENASLRCPEILPYMFKNWHEYALYLSEKMIQEEKNKEEIKKILLTWHGKKGDYKYAGKQLKNDLCKNIINVILSNDWDYTKLTNFEDSPAVSHWRDFMKTKKVTKLGEKNKYIKEVLKWKE